MYEGFISHLQSNSEDIVTEKPRLMSRSNLTFFDEKLRIKIQFLYHPFVDNKMVELFQEWAKEDKPPSIIVAGNGLAMIRATNSTTPGAFNEYTSNLTRLIQPIERLNEKFTRVLWTLQAPVNEEKLMNEYKMITNEQINLFNKEVIILIFIIIKKG